MDFDLKNTVLLSSLSPAWDVDSPKRSAPRRRRNGVGALLSASSSASFYSATPSATCCSNIDYDDDDSSSEGSIMQTIFGESPMIDDDDSVNDLIIYCDSDDEDESDSDCTSCAADVSHPLTAEDAIESACDVFKHRKETLPKFGNEMREGSESKSRVTVRRSKEDKNDVSSITVTFQWSSKDRGDVKDGDASSTTATTVTTSSSTLSSSGSGGSLGGFSDLEGPDRDCEGETTQLIEGGKEGFYPQFIPSIDFVGFRKLSTVDEEFGPDMISNKSDDKGSEFSVDVSNNLLYVPANSVIQVNFREELAVVDRSFIQGDTKGVGPTNEPTTKDPLKQRRKGDEASIGRSDKSHRISDFISIKKFHRGRSKRGLEF